MPNWCRNMLYVTARNDENEETVLQLKAFREKLLGGVDETHESPCLHLLDTFVPMPYKYKGTVEAMDWQLANWGVNSGDCQCGVLEDEDTVMTLDFDTPWGPPIERIQKISAHYPRLHFYIEWEERGYWSKGYVVIEDARIVINFSQEQMSDQQMIDEGGEWWTYLRARGVPLVGMRYDAIREVVAGMKEPDDLRELFFGSQDIGYTIIHPITKELIPQTEWLLSPTVAFMLDPMVTEYRRVLALFAECRAPLSDFLDEHQGFVRAVGQPVLYLHYPSLVARCHQESRAPANDVWARLRAWSLIEPDSPPDGKTPATEWWKPTWLAEEFLAGRVGLPNLVLAFGGAHSAPIAESGWFRWEQLRELDE